MDRPIQERMWGTIKLKARDIVPFWPKGRSTESLARRFRTRWFYTWMAWNEPQKVEEEYTDSENYHRAQKAMVNNFRNDQRAMDILRGKYSIDVVLNLARCFMEGSDERIAQEFLPCL
jgi:hypothetical protein